VVLAKSKLGSTKPRIAIPEPCSYDKAYSDRSIKSYLEAVEAAGGEPVVIPLGLTPEETAKRITGCSAVLLPGSKADVDPQKFGAERHPKTAAPDPLRDAADELLIQDAYNLRKPIFGICYGLQFMVYSLGGKVRAAERREYGHAQVDVLTNSSLFGKLPRSLEVWMSHGDEALELPAGFELTAKSPTAVAGIENAEKKMFAVQFHPEVRHTRLGTEILRNFIFDICKAKPTWTPQHFVDETVARVRAQVGRDRRGRRALSL